MLHFPRWQIVLIVLVVLGGLPGHPAELLSARDGGELAELDAEAPAGARPRPPGRRLPALRGRQDRLRPAAPPHAAQRRPQGDARAAHASAIPGLPSRTTASSSASAIPSRSRTPGPGWRRSATRSSPRCSAVRASTSSISPISPDGVAVFTLFAGGAHPTGPRHRQPVDRGHQPAHRRTRHDRAEHPAPGRRPHPGRGAGPRRSRRG